jgi:O-acetyl-ADP-ribose deacetylase (regulator of RNase III)
MIKESCLSCLKRAQREKMKSIAFPAVGSGQQGMPLVICAIAMTNAVEEYMKDNDPQKGAVADIRFVDTDPFAVEVFHTQLTKRYGDSPARNDTGRQSKHKTFPPVNSDGSSVGKLSCFYH